MAQHKDWNFDTISMPMWPKPTTDGPVPEPPFVMDLPARPTSIPGLGTEMRIRVLKCHTEGAMTFIDEAELIDVAFMNFDGEEGGPHGR